MQASTRDQLEEAFEWCVENDKEFEYMVQCLQDAAEVSYDCAFKFILGKAEEVSHE